ncbi:MAG: DUF1294 domain-containing protein [Bacteroidales bacterium]|nr:DUF1294 domain-containing protein [Bacteroidales bacterium]MBQ7818355.1 DUF1294 domain-containing protein [Bacteroidales bacterium]
MKYQYVIAIYLVAINLTAYILYAIDKYKSKRQKWRISEKALIIVALVGGSVGALFAMKMFRHKTKHKKFTIGVPLILIAQILMLCMLTNFRF